MARTRDSRRQVEYRRRWREQNPERSRAEGRNRARQRQAQITAIKLTLSCTDCGWRPTDAAEASALDFDHIDPATKRRTGGGEGGSLVRGGSWKRVLEEIAKCEPRCARCHRIRTHRERHSQYRTNPTPATQPIPDQLPLFE